MNGIKRSRRGESVEEFCTTHFSSGRFLRRSSLLDIRCFERNVFFTPILYEHARGCKTIVTDFWKTRHNPMIIGWPNECIEAAIIVSRLTTSPQLMAPISNSCEALDWFVFLNSFAADDSSGRYTNGFFWGNSFFTGSATECSYIGYDFNKKNAKYPAKASVVGSSMISEVAEFNSEPKKKANSGVPRVQLSSPKILDEPPYKLGFFMMKILINGTLSPIVSISLFHCTLWGCAEWNVSQRRASTIVKIF